MAFRIFIFFIVTWSFIVNSKEMIEGIEVKGFNKTQIEILEKTVSTLKNLKKTSLKINPKVYRRLSQFETLFGFSFDGERLLTWIKKRIKRILYKKKWTVAITKSDGRLYLWDHFFGLTLLEKIYTLIHEARHVDDHGYPHVYCPSNAPFVSAASPEFDLSQTKACDQTKNGAYSFHSAFLFECYAYGLIDQREAGLLYNSSISRVLP